VPTLTAKNYLRLPPALALGCPAFFSSWLSTNLTGTGPTDAGGNGTYWSKLTATGMVETIEAGSFSNMCQTSIFTDGILSDEAIAAAAGNACIAGRDSGDRIYWYRVVGNSWFFAGGAGLSSTVLTGGK
jgi:hypothetical protein